MTISLAELRIIMRTAFGEGDVIADVQRMTSGSVNRTALVTLVSGNRVIVRIGPGEQQAAAGPTWLTSFGLRRELAAITLLQDSLEILPVTIAHDFSRSTIDADWVVQEVMPGKPWPAAVPTLSDAERLALWQQLGRILRQIHAVRGNAFGPPAWGSRFPTWADLVLDDLDGLTTDARRYRIDLAPFTVLHDLVTSHRDELSLVTPQLIHSDLSLDHVFIKNDNNSWCISGLIDLEFARFADIASEGLLLDRLIHDDAETDAFFTGYGGQPQISPLRQQVATRLNTLWEITDSARLQHRP